MDIPTIRKLAAAELGKRAFAELTRGEDDSLDQVLLYKLAQAEDRPLLEYCTRLPGNPFHAYEALGGKFKQAFGTPMFSGVAAPDPVVQATATKPPSLSSTEGVSSGPKAPSASSGPQSPGAGTQNVQSVPEPSVPGAGASAGVGGGMG